MAEEILQPRKSEKVTRLSRTYKLSEDVVLKIRELAKASNNSDTRVVEQSIRYVWEKLMANQPERVAAGAKVKKA